MAEISGQASHDGISIQPRRIPGARRLLAERRGLWAYYYVRPEALDELAAWLR